MTVEDERKIDLVAHRDDDPLVRLVITDHLDWSDELAHLHVLQSKINAYLAFVESGQFVREFPQLRSRPVQIEVAFLYEPTQHACDHFLGRVAELVRDAGLEFSWRAKERS